jgi:DNA-binding MarR family transcriptional regulator
VYILLIMIEQHNQEVNMAKVLEVASFCACANLRKASRAVTQLYDESLQPTGLRATQFTLLVALSVTGSISITDLAQQLVMDRTTLTRNLALLERQGLVAIAKGDDQRTRMVTLTHQGREAVVKALPLWEQAQTCIVSGLGRERWNTLLADLSDVVSLAGDL